MSLLARSGPDESSAEATTSGSAQDPKARRSSASLTTTATDDEDGHDKDEEEEEEDENERTSTSKSGGGGSEKGGEPKKKGKSTKAKWKKIKNAVGVSKEVTSATMRRAQLRIGILEKQPQERTREEVLVLEELMLRIKFLEQLARPSRLEICRVASYKQLETGNVLFQQGDAGDATPTPASRWSWRRA